MARPVQPGAPLTPREEQVLAGIAAGHTYKQAARTLGMSVSTLRTHMHSAMGKLGAVDGTSAVLAWLRSEQHVAEVADEMLDRHGRLSREGWQWLVGEVVTELLGPADSQNGGEARAA